MSWVAPVIVAAGAMILILLGRRLDRTVAGSGNPVVALHVRYQPVALLVALASVGLVRLLVPDHADYLAVGDWSASASGLGILGVADGDSWMTVGLTFLVIMTAVTALVVWLQVGRGRVSGSAVLLAVPWAVAFSIVNALTEELLFRLTIAEALGPVLAAGAVALISAVLFGIPHWFGNPGRLPGVLLAGFMGWFLTLSVLQTGGLGWAWAMHVVPDIVIFTMLVAAAQTARNRSVSVAAGVTR
ncbi:MAG: CPBP family intramembrane glutamic endopeptidase [Actinomycetes bacterium]